MYIEDAHQLNSILRFSIFHPSSSATAAVAAVASSIVHIPRTHTHTHTYIHTHTHAREVHLLLIVARMSSAEKFAVCAVFEPAARKQGARAARGATNVEKHVFA